MNILNSGRFSMGSSGAGVLKKLISKYFCKTVFYSLYFSDMRDKPEEYPPSLLNYVPVYGFHLFWQVTMFMD